MTMSLEETMELIINVMQFADSWETRRAQAPEEQASAPLFLAYEGMLS